MNGIVVISNGNSITISSNDYSSVMGMTERSYHKDNLTTISNTGQYIELYMSMTNENWTLTYDSSYTGQELFIIDTIDGVAPTSLDDLFDKLAVLRG